MSVGKHLNGGTCGPSSSDIPRRVENGDVSGRVAERGANGRFVDRGEEDGKPVIAVRQGRTGPTAGDQERMAVDEALGAALDAGRMDVVGPNELQRHDCTGRQQHDKTTHAPHAHQASISHAGSRAYEDGHTAVFGRFGDISAAASRSAAEFFAVTGQLSPDV
jgi:hypothetical protein